MSYELIVKHYLITLAKCGKIMPMYQSNRNTYIKRCIERFELIQMTYIEIHTTCIASPLSHCDFVYNSMLDWWCLIHIEHHKPNENILWKFVRSLYRTSPIPCNNTLASLKIKKTKALVAQLANTLLAYGNLHSSLNTHSLIPLPICQALTPNTSL